jgi:hypothetical protein
VLRDEDLDLAFLRPTTKPERRSVALDLTDAAKPALLDQVLNCCRGLDASAAGRLARRSTTSARSSRSPAFYVLAGASSGVGLPAFLTNGRVVGLHALRQIDAGRASMASMMGRTESMGMLGVILPAADVLEIAKQAPEVTKTAALGSGL